MPYFYIWTNLNLGKIWEKQEEEEENGLNQMFIISHTSLITKGRSGTRI